MVMAVPFLHALRRHTNDEIWAMGKESAIHLYNGLDFFDRFVPIDNKGLSLFFDTAARLKRINFSRAIALPHSFRSVLFFYNLRFPQIVGYSRNKRGFMLDLEVKESGGLEPTVEHYLGIVDSLGADRTISSPVLAVTEDEEEKFDAEFTDIIRPFGIMIAGAQYGSSKCWPPDHFSELADMAIERFNADIYILPGRGEESLALKIREGSARKDRVRVRLMNIRDMKVCISRASFVVSNDTGPRHIAAALRVPTVALAGPMDERYTTYPSECTRVLSKDVSCRPCNKKRCDVGHECLKSIKPEEVLQALEDILEKSA